MKTQIFKYTGLMPSEIFIMLAHPVIYGRIHCFGDICTGHLPQLLLCSYASDWVMYEGLGTGSRVQLLTTKVYNQFGKLVDKAAKAAFRWSCVQAHSVLVMVRRSVSNLK